MQTINKKAPVVFTQSITIHATIAKVWAVQTDVNGWINWQTDITKSSLSQPLIEGSTFKWKTGGANITSTLHTVAANNTLGWTGKTFGAYAIHNWHLHEKNGTVTVLAEESMEGLLVKFFKKTFQAKLELGMKQWLLLLKKECEKKN